MLSMTIYEALEMAGFSPSNAGFGLGSGSGDRVPPEISMY